MGVFFFISGYIWERTAQISNVKEGMTYLIKKTIQIMLPFMVWSFLVYPYFFQTDWKSWNIELIIQEFTNPHLWFLLTLYAYGFYFVLFKLFNKLGGAKLGIAFWLTSIAILTFIWYKYEMFKLALLYMPYFAAGTLMSQTNTTEKIFNNHLISNIGLLCIFLLMAFWTSGATSMLNIGIKLIVTFSVILLTYMTCTCLSWNKHFDNFIIECGKQSLPIYIIHWNFLHIFDIKPVLPQNELLAFIPVFLFAVIICYTCILFKKIIQLFPVMNLFLFGDYQKHLK